MKAFVMFLAVAIGAVAGIAASQDAAAGATGEIVRYDAGKAIVIRHADDRVVTYELSPTLVAPAEVRVGKRVSIVSGRGEDGVVRVTQLVEVAPETPKAVTVTGDVVRYEAGRSIVVRAPDGPEVAYALAPGLAVPATVAAGRRVSIVTEAPGTGPVLVTRIAETASVAASGAEGPKSEITTVYGVVTAYEPGRTITVTQPDRKLVTYSIDRESALPPNVARGRRVVVRTVTRPGLERPLVRKVTVSPKKSG
jgi:hypothetical protein